MVAYNLLYLQFQVIQCHLPHSRDIRHAPWRTHIYVGKSFIYAKFRKINKNRRKGRRQQNQRESVEGEQVKGIQNKIAMYPQSDSKEQFHLSIFPLFSLIPFLRLFQNSSLMHYNLGNEYLKSFSFSQKLNFIFKSSQRERSIGLLPSDIAPNQSVSLSYNGCDKTSRASYSLHCCHVKCNRHPLWFL